MLAFAVRCVRVVYGLCVLHCLLAFGISCQFLVFFCSFVLRLLRVHSFIAVCCAVFVVRGSRSRRFVFFAARVFAVLVRAVVALELLCHGGFR